MMVRRATLLVLLFAALALFTAGCGNDEEPAQESGAAPTATQGGEDAGEPEGESEEEREREEAEAREAAGKECSEVGDLDGEPKNQPPEEIRMLDGAKVYESEGPFGKTERFFAAVDGDASELPEKRDEAAALLEQNGYKKLSADEEAGTEAEAHMEGNGKTVDIQVITLCEGKLRIRYTVS